jgi:hypothetical protein
MQCWLLENFHWSPSDLAKSDIDIILPLILYFPYWKGLAERKSQEKLVYADQIDWL